MVYTFSWQRKPQKVLLSWKWFWIGNLINEKVTIHMQSGRIQRTTFIVLLALCDLKNGTAFIWFVAARASPKLVNLEPRPPLKKMWFFWSNPYEIECVITSVIEMLELPNFGHMITSTIWLVTSWTEVMMSLWCQNIFILRRPRAAIFAKIIKIVTMFIKTIFKDSKKKEVIRIRNYVSKRKLYPYFLIS